MKKNVLIIDDNSTFSNSLSGILKEEGFLVTVFNSVQFIQSVKKIHPSIILVDVWFENEKRGITLCQALQKYTNLNPRVVLMSSDKDLPFFARQYNIQHFLQKPFNPSKLINLLQKM